MSRNQILLIVIGGLLLAIGIPVTLFLISQQQDTRSRASEVVYPDNLATNPTPATPPAQTQQEACPAPAAPASTTVQYPHMDGDNFELTQADCGWESVEEATTYNISITETDTGKLIRDDSVPASTTGVTFPVTQGMTYKCEIEAVNDCGTVSAVTADEQICSTEGLIISPSPTAPPVTPIPTTPPVVTNPPTAPTVPPTPPPAGAAEVLAIGGGIAALAVAVGAALMFW